MNLYENVKKIINNYITPNDRILVCVSAGPDSMALLDILYSFKEAYKLSLYVAHFNHKLRGRESKKDEALARKAAAGYKLPFICGRMDIRKEAKRQKGGIEKTARDARYRFFIMSARRYKINKIATAHTKDDNIETVLFRFINGSGISGLKGIPAQRRIKPGDFGCDDAYLKYPGVYIIRPLISIYKNELLRHLKEKKIKYNIDRTNRGVAFARNRIRNRLIPLIEKEYNRNFRENLSNAAQILTDEDEYMEDMAGKLLPPAIKKTAGKIQLDKKIKSFHKSIRMRIIKLVLENILAHKRNISFKLISAIDRLLNSSKDTAVSLPEGVMLKTGGEKLSFTRNTVAGNKVKKILLYAVGKGKNVSAGGRKLEFKTIKTPGKIRFGDKSIAWLDASKIKFPICVRAREQGDKFMPFGLDKKVRLKKYLNSHKMKGPVIIVKDREKILWLAGDRIDERCKIDENTRKVLKITID